MIEPRLGTYDTPLRRPETGAIVGDSPFMDSLFFVVRYPLGPGCPVERRPPARRIAAASCDDLSHISPPI